MAETHGVSNRTPVTGADAEQVARVMAALGTASRVRILAALRVGSHTVGELTAAVEMTQPAVSHQLRILRDLRLVVGRRNGRHTVYDLHDSHVERLLDESLRHIRHTGALTSAEPIDAVASSHHPPTHDHPKEPPMTDEHAHERPHTHEHSHGDVSHDHAHTGHEHDHVEHDHEHEHEHDGKGHGHPHVHQAGLEDVHEHGHA